MLWACCPVCWSETASSCPHPRPWQQALADTDHLAILHAIWTAETTPAREQRYTEMLMAALPPGYRQESGHQAKWLWKTLRAAELAGPDPGQVLATPIGERNLVGARDVPAVIDARLRRRTGSLVPLPAGLWSAQLPAIADPERRAFAAQIAAAMDERKERIGEHAAENALPGCEGVPSGDSTTPRATPNDLLIFNCWRLPR
jgi:hypothetical protein